MARRSNLISGMDKNDFNKVIETHHRQVINIAYRFLNDRSGAEDIAQEVFLRFYQALPRYTPKAKLSTYLYKITKNLCLNYLRKRRPEKFFSLDETKRDSEEKILDLPDEKVLSPRTMLENEELRTKIYEALAKLPPNQRTAVILKRYENLGCDEIAGVLGCRVSAVKSLLHRAKITLRKELAFYLEK